jgi:hypothetical protein
MSPVRPIKSCTELSHALRLGSEGTAATQTRFGWRNLTIALASVLAGANIASCASAAPYNPQNLDAARLGRIAEICQTTMGLKDWEAPSPVWGAAQDPHLDPGENHYEGCIASLSDAQRGADQDQEVARADTSCRARGYGEGSPDLAECVLHSEGARMSSAQSVDQPYHGARLSRAANRSPVSSFYTASPGEIARRERAACAELGLNPLYAAFDNCVAQMDDTFFRIDNPSF